MLPARRSAALAEPALRLAKQTARADAYAQLKAGHPTISDAPLGPDEGQIAVVIEAGQAPRKQEITTRAGQSLIAVPVYNPRQAAVPTATVRFSSGEMAAIPVTSLDAVAKQHLDDRIGKLIAKSLASVGVKAGLAAAVGVATKNEELGLATFALLALTQQADTRSWLSLPAEFQIARARVKSGAQRVTVTAGGRTTEHDVDVAAGRLKVLVVRRY